MEDNNFWLVNLPHAGGSSTVFKGWDKKINCNVLNIEYPGHWTRMREPMIHSFEKLSEDVISVIVEKVPKQSKVYIFGHSVGAIMAWYISPILFEKGYCIKKLFLSASQNPGAFPEKSILQAISDEDMLELIGYKPEEHPQNINKQFIQTFLPILKTDMQVCKSFRCDAHYVDVESVALYGKQDSFTNIDEIKKWNLYVKLDEIKAFSGRHLFIEERENIEKIVELINESLSNDA